jgi:hypothetical protein
LTVHSGALASDPGDAQIRKLLIKPGLRILQSILAPQKSDRRSGYPPKVPIAGQSRRANQWLFSARTLASVPVMNPNVLHPHGSRCQRSLTDLFCMTPRGGASTDRPNALDHLDLVDDVRDLTPKICDDVTAAR